MKGFKEFLFRGNIIELAVAFVIGSAFAKLVDVVVSNLVTPVINALGSPKTGGLAFLLRDDVPGSKVDIAAIINSFIVFTLTALIVYLVFVLPMKKFKELRNGGPLLEDPTEIELLTEIRDSLRHGGSAGTTGGATPMGGAPVDPR